MNPPFFQFIEICPGERREFPPHDEDDGNFCACFDQVSGGNQSVSPVVAFATEDDHLFAGNIGACGPVHAALASLMEGHTALTTGLTSQIISNVPAAVLLSGFTADWRGLLVGSNLGGLGTPIASLASLISLKVYLRTPGARPGRYLLLFTAANGAALVLLCLCAALLAG